MENNMPTLNKDGSTRKKYTTKRMIMKKNRKNGQKKAWDTRRALYPETNGYKPQQVEDAPKVEPKVDVEPEPNKEEEEDNEGRVLTPKVTSPDVPPPVNPAPATTLVISLRLMLSIPINFISN